MPHGARTVAALGLLVASGAGCRGQPRGACNPAPPPGVLGTVCGFPNPEDVEAVPAARVVVVSEMRMGSDGGALAALHLDAPLAPRRLWPTGDAARDVATGPVAGDAACTTPPAADTFAPHGLAAAAADGEGATRLAVVAHRPGREAIELFELRGVGEAARLAWRGCVPLPPHAVGNDLAIAPDGEILVSNFVPSKEGLAFLSTIR